MLRAPDSAHCEIMLLSCVLAYDPWRPVQMVLLLRYLHIDFHDSGLGGLRLLVSYSFPGAEVLCPSEAALREEGHSRRHLAAKKARD